MEYANVEQSSESVRVGEGCERVAGENGRNSCDLSMDDDIPSKTTTSVCFISDSDCLA